MRGVLFENCILVAGQSTVSVQYLNNSGCECGCEYGRRMYGCQHGFCSEKKSKVRVAVRGSVHEMIHFADGRGWVHVP